MHEKKLRSAGKPLQQAEKALIMLHGRGGNAGDILGIAPHLKVADFSLIAPQASGNTWYPYSFMAPRRQNEPWLSSALGVLQETIKEVNAAGIPSERIFLLGFSQGACLMLEFAARNAAQYGGLAAFTGGLIGEDLEPGSYAGDFKATPVFIGTGDPDAHVPLERVSESAGVLEKMNARVKVEVYKGRPHTISTEEIDAANTFVFNKLS